MLYNTYGVGNMNFNEVIEKRFSVRKFINKPVEKDKIDRILKTGHIAPTGCNFQPQRILVIESNEALKKLKECTKCHFDAPLAMLICYNKDESWVRKYDGAMCAPVDAAIVSTHMMLEAHEIGVGTCWVMSFDPEAMKKAYSIPSNYEPHALLVMGYPHPDAKPYDMHSKFRPLDEIVFYESF